MATSSLTASPALRRGGPFVAILQKTKLLRDSDGHGIARPLLATMALTWLPLVVLAPFSRGSVSLLKELSVHARLLVSVPLLFEADVLLHKLTAETIKRFAEARLVEGLDPRSVGSVQRQAERLRSSAWGELVCLLLALFVGQIGLWGKGANPLSFQGFATYPISAATLWYGCVALPIFLFLLYRSLWRWLIWAWVLWRFSRMEFRLAPTHPDLSGGLSPLAIPNRGFALILLAISVGIAGAWGSQIAFHGATIKTFAGPFALLVAMGLLLGLGPLLAFSGKLFRARLVGRVQYGELACAYTTQFDDRWILHPEREGLLGTPDLQSLADLGSSYAVVRRMRPVPFDFHDALLLVVALGLPICPLILTEVPLRLLMHKLAQALF